MVSTVLLATGQALQGRTAAPRPRGLNSFHEAWPERQGCLLPYAGGPRPGLEQAPLCHPDRNKLAAEDRRLQERLLAENGPTEAVVAALAAARAYHLANTRSQDEARELLKTLTRLYRQYLEHQDGLFSRSPMGYLSAE